MEISQVLEQGVASNRSTWISGGIKVYFLQPTALVNLLEPLILALEWPGDYRQLVESLPHFSDDLDLTAFLNVMAAINYNNERIDLAMHAVPDKYLPCLFIPEDGTPVILLKREGGRFLVVDGVAGEQRLVDTRGVRGTVYHFSLFDTDRAVVIRESETFKENFIKFRPLALQIFVITLMYNIFVATVPIYIMYVYDRVIPSESIRMSFSFLIGVLIFLASSQLLAISRIKIVAYIGARLDKTMGESIIRHLLYLPPSFTENNTVGAQIARIKSFDNIRDFFTSNIAIMACEFPFAAVFLLMIFAIGGWLGFIPIVLGMIFYVIYHISNPIVDRYIKTQAAQHMLKQSFLLESFSRLRDIKQTGQSRVWTDKFNDMLISLSKNGFDNAYYNSVLNVISEVFMMLAALTILVLGALTSMYSQLSLGVLIAIMMLTWKVLNPLKSFFSSLPKIEQIRNSITQVNKLFSIPTERTAEKIALSNDVEKSKIEFNRVTFKYKPELPPSILGISFIVQPGELICVTGKNSSGKSTLLRLILGLYKAQAGNILINDKNVQQYDPIEMRHTIAYMPQTIQLFYGTIKQNMLLGNLVSTEQDIIEASKLADVHDDIMRLPENYNTRVGDQRSNRFSAGFLQKIVLARTYLKKSSIYLFDESSAGFDEVTEKKFIDVINTLRKKSTIIWVTHRPSHLKVADKILYMEAGEVALFGDSTKVLERLPRSLI